jgi:hypothetical protein
MSRRSACQQSDMRLRGDDQQWNIPTESSILLSAENLITHTITQWPPLGMRLAALQPTCRSQLRINMLSVPRSMRCDEEVVFEKII